LVRARHDPAARIKSTTLGTKEIMAELDRDYKEPEKKEVVREIATSINAAHYSTGAVSAMFTSTTMPVTTIHEAAIRDDDSVRYERVKKKGYVRILTSCGPINFELHCDLAPKACENFILLCKRGYYNGTIFHRSIRHFMIQGGDPTGKGTGGESAWGKTFGDEIKPNLHHEGRGILCMANSGPATNKSQFYITYRSCKHLDGKHTIFGKVVGGMETLSAMEKIEVDNKDRPIEDIIFMKAEIFSNPFDEVDAILDEERAKLRAAAGEEQERLAGKTKPRPPPDFKVYKEGVGKYINPKRKREEIIEPQPTSTSSLGLGQGSTAKKTTVTAGSSSNSSYEFNFNKW